MAKLSYIILLALVYAIFFTEGCIYYSKYLDFQKPEEKGGRNQVKKEEKEDLTYIMRFFDVLFTMVIQKIFFIFLISNGK